MMSAIVMLTIITCFAFGICLMLLWQLSVGGTRILQTCVLRPHVLKLHLEEGRKQISAGLQNGFLPSLGKHTAPKTQVKRARVYSGLENTLRHFAILPESILCRQCSQHEKILCLPGLGQRLAPTRQ